MGFYKCKIFVYAINRGFTRYSERASIIYKALRIFGKVAVITDNFIFLGKDQSVNFGSNHCYNVIVGLRPLKGPM